MKRKAYLKIFSIALAICMAVVSVPADCVRADEADDADVIVSENAIIEDTEEFMPDSDDIGANGQDIHTAPGTVYLVNGNGKTKYRDLFAAIDAAKELYESTDEVQTLSLASDFKLAANDRIIVDFPLVLDLKEYNIAGKVSGNAVVALASNGGLFERTQLIVKGTTGAISNSYAGGAIDVTSNTILQVESGNIKGGIYGVYVTGQDSVLNLVNGSISASSAASGAVVYGVKSGNEGTISLTGGKISAKASHKSGSAIACGYVIDLYPDSSYPREAFKVSDTSLTATAGDYACAVDYATDDMNPYIIMSLTGSSVKATSSNGAAIGINSNCDLMCESNSISVTGAGRPLNISEDESISRPLCGIRYKNADDIIEQKLNLNSNTISVNANNTNDNEVYGVYSASLGDASEIVANTINVSGTNAYGVLNIGGLNAECNNIKVTGEELAVGIVVTGLDMDIPESDNLIASGNATMTNNKISANASGNLGFASAIWGNSADFVRLKNDELSAKASASESYALAAWLDNVIQTTADAVSFVATGKFNATGIELNAPDYAENVELNQCLVNAKNVDNNKNYYACGVEIYGMEDDQDISVSMSDSNISATGSYKTKAADSGAYGVYVGLNNCFSAGNSTIYGTDVAVISAQEDDDAINLNSSTELKAAAGNKTVVFEKATHQIMSAGYHLYDLDGDELLEPGMSDYVSVTPVAGFSVKMEVVSDLEGMRTVDCLECGDIIEPKLYANDVLISDGELSIVSCSYENLTLSENVDVYDDTNGMQVDAVGKQTIRLNMQLQRSDSAESITYSKLFKINVLEPKCTLSYMANGGYFATQDDNSLTETNREIDVRKGDSPILPDNPIRKGYEFVGWFLDTDLNEDFSETSTISDNMVLYAGWVTEGLHVDFTEGVDHYTYTGGKIKPQMQVYYGTTPLVEGVHYTVSYKNNVNVATKDADKAPLATITGKGDYKGTLKTKFSIEQADFSNVILSNDAVLVAYSGKEINPEKYVSLRLSDNKLAKSKDYTYRIEKKVDDDFVAVNKIIDAGIYNIIYSGSGNIIADSETEQTVELCVATKGSLADATITGVEKRPYSSYVTEDDQGVILPNLKVVDKDGNQLQQGDDYIVTYQNNKAIGTASVIIQDHRDYSKGENVVIKTFKITGVSMEDVTYSWLDSSEEFIYDGQSHAKNFTLSYKGTELVDGDDYIVTYTDSKKQSDPVNAGTVTVKIAGINGYSGSIKKTYKINKCDISKAKKVNFNSESEGVISYTTYPFSQYRKGGSKIDFVLTQSIGGLYNELENGFDYSVSYKNNTSFSATKQPTAIVTGKGNYKGSFKVPFKVLKVDLSENTDVYAKDIKYTGKAGKFTTTVTIKDGSKTLKAGTDYDKNFVYYNSQGARLKSTDVVHVGDVITVVIYGKGNYLSSVSTSFKVTEKGIVNSADVKAKTKVFISDNHNVVLTKDDLTVKVNKKKLTYGVDYVICDYAKNMHKGTATAKIKGIGAYGGEKTIKFVIKPKTMTLYEAAMYGAYSLSADLYNSFN